MSENHIHGNNSTRTHNHHCNSLVELNRHQANVRPECVTLIFLPHGELEVGRITYGELDRRAFAARVQADGLSGQFVLLMLPSSIYYVVAFVGYLYAGAIPVPGYPPTNSMHAERMAHIVADCNANGAIVATGSMLNAITSRLGQFFPEGLPIGFIQRKTRSSMQREDSPTMETGLERIAAKARCEPVLRFTSLAHYITQDRVWTNPWKIPSRSAAGVDGQTVAEAKENFDAGLSRCFNPPTVGDSSAKYPARVHPEARQTGDALVGCADCRRPGALAKRRRGSIGHAIYEQDFMPCSFGGRLAQNAHKALTTLNEVVVGGN